MSDYFEVCARSAKNHNQMSEFKQGDWNCKACGNHNFARRTECKQCQAAKPAAGDESPTKKARLADANEAPAGAGFLAGDWNCAACGNHNFARRTACNKCQAAKPGGAVENDAPIGAENGAAAAAAAAEEPVKRYYLAVDIERAGASMGKYGILAIGACFGRDDGTVLATRAFCWNVPQKDGFEPRCWNEFWVNFPQVLERIAAEASQTPMADFLLWVGELEQKYGPFGRQHKTQKLSLVSDNPAYDIGIINVEIFKLWRGFEQMPLLNSLRDDVKYWYNDTPICSHDPELRERIRSAFAALDSLDAVAPAELRHKKSLEAIEKQGGRPLAEMFSGYVSTDDPTEQENGLTPEQKARVEAAIKAPHDHWPVNDATQIFERMCAVKKELQQQKQSNGAAK